jgi:hypothetical protein
MSDSLTSLLFKPSIDALRSGLAYSALGMACRLIPKDSDEGRWLVLALQRMFRDRPQFDRKGQEITR